MEINVVTLYNIVKTMPQQKHNVIKAKGGPMKYYCVRLCFGKAVNIAYCNSLYNWITEWF